MLKGILLTLSKNIRQGSFYESLVSLCLVLINLVANKSHYRYNKSISTGPNLAMPLNRGLLSTKLSASKSTIKLDFANETGTSYEALSKFQSQGLDQDQAFCNAKEQNRTPSKSHGEYALGSVQNKIMGAGSIQAIGMDKGSHQNFWHDIKPSKGASSDGMSLSSSICSNFDFRAEACKAKSMGFLFDGDVSHGHGYGRGYDWGNVSCRGRGRYGKAIARLFKALALGAYLSLALVGGAAVVSGCSSSDLPEHEVLVKDPIDFKVEGISGELLANVEAHLNSMAVISKKRAIFYVREIEEVSRKALRAYGYYHPKIKVNLPNKDDDKALTVTVNIEQGKPLFIRNCTVEILGEGLEYQVFQDILASSQLHPYQKLNHGHYEKLKKDIHQAALSLGFFDGKFTSSRIMVYQDQNAADIELLYDSGKRYKFGKLLMDVTTAKLFRPSENLQKFQQGDDFSTLDINNFSSYLNQTGYYNSVDVRPVLDKAQGYEVPLELRLDRRPNNNVRLGMGFSTDEGPRVLMEWNKPLLNDRGDSFSSLTTLTMVTQEAQFIYKIPRNNPNLDYYTINASQTHVDLNDTLSDRSQLALHYVANETGDWRRDYALRLEYEDYSQGGEEGYALNLIPALKLTRRESSGGFDPSRGYSLSMEVLGASRVITDHSFVQVNVSYKGVISPTENSRFLFKVNQGATFGSDSLNVPPSLRYFVGGDNSIRGFGYRDRAPIQDIGVGLRGGRYATTGTAELQFPFGVSSSRLALFVDAGLATNEYNREKEFLYGPGLGYRFLSPYGIVRVDIAMGIEKDRENQYHLHFAFGPEF